MLKIKQNFWQPNSWREKRCLQQPLYTQTPLLKTTLDNLSSLPPLVIPQEIHNLKHLLAKAQQGEYFLLQGGDCAERFSDCRPEIIHRKLKILAQMSLILSTGLNKPIITVGRIAGQYAKPRSDERETQDTVTLNSYRGDLINDIEFTPQARTPNPERLLQGYANAALTLNYIRTLTDKRLNSNLSLDAYLYEEEYQPIVAHLVKNFAGRFSTQNDNKLFTSHEALHLQYEQALTRFSQTDNKWYNLSTHFPWVGMRTAFTDSAHIEYVRGIANPVAVKIGPACSTQDLQTIIKILNPLSEAGRLTLIPRLGVTQINKRLPDLIKAAQDTNIDVLWSCDPMHGNTRRTSEKIKTRYLEDIIVELKQSIEIHHSLNSQLSGVHFELTGEEVTECVGGISKITDSDLQKVYQSTVDPRLNYNQAIEIALALVRFM